jgi:hypothetical protein
MTRAEVEALARASKGWLCLRIVRGADGRVRTLDTPPVVPLVRRVSRVAAGAMTIAFVAGAAAPSPALAAGAPVVAAAAAAPGPQAPRSDGSGSVEGVIVDPQGAVVAGVSLALTNAETGVTTTATSDDEGRYRFDGVAEGSYELACEAPGFMRAVHQDLRVVDGQPLTLEVTLEVGEIMTGVVIVDNASPAESLVHHTAEREAQGGGDVSPPPLVQAMLDANEPSVRKVLRNGVDVNARGAFGDTALMFVVGDAKDVKALLKAGADVNTRDRFGVTALMHAALYDEPDVVRLLLRAGADVNAADADGLTALMAAALEGNDRMVKALLAAGAYVNARDARGKTALAYAREQEHEEVVKILEAAGADE